MPTILLTNHYSNNPLFIMEKEIPPGFDLILLDKSCKEELIEKASKADYLLVSGRIPIDEQVINAAANLKMIQRTGVGIDMLNIEVIKEKGIPVYVNQGVNSRSVAEHTIMLILSVLRHLPLADSSIRMGNWFKQELGVECNELYNKTVGLVGLGNIGIEVAKMLKVFGVKVLYYKPSRLIAAKEKELNIDYRHLTELLKEVDILSLHCPLNSETEGMIGIKEITAMKPGSIIINTSRGRLIVEEELINALRTGHIRGAGLDVFSEEPLSKNNPLLGLENVVLTPHIGGVTLEAFRRMMREALINIKFFEEGKMEMIESKRLQI
ncbi:2-hydroxyacid dehydrogenase [Tissierella sp. MSJ-40]|uniref:2-hydroxyacid dehydrogenase n=1 Tax=Tissierella simiarum TaxID=2841534 RepID=A0ABS6E334_9FIRM|nr:2-hydroxyacid dehydrogenase [Tissierella simiarum]MBU5436658.1 2-hydroxyacid dehydrogenase [Tissierella simiarum]